MRLPLLVIMCCLSAVVFAADTWRWVDENGIVHYSDRPAPGAERVQLGEAQSFSMPQPARATAEAADQETAFR